VLDALSFIYRQYHRYNEAHTLQHRREKLASELTARDELYDLYFSLGYVHENISDYATALMWFGRASSYAQTMESPAMLLACMSGRMRAWREWNRWEEAQKVAREMLRLIDLYQQDEKQQQWALETLATIAYRTGRQEEGDQYTRRYKKLIEQQAERSGIESIDFVETKMHAIYLAREEWDQAADAYLEKLRRSEPLPPPEIIAHLAELLVITGKDKTEQAAMCERAIKLCEEARDRKSLSIALRARGRMYVDRELWSQAEEDLLRSLQLCVDLDLPWERGKTLYYLGVFYQQRANNYAREETQKRNEDLGRARYHFEQAFGFFEALKADPAAQRARLAIMQESTAEV
jgi:tetratricopeptide (TPR) repeat protein